MTLKKQTVYLKIPKDNSSGNFIEDKNALIVKEQFEDDKYWDALVKPCEGYFLSEEELRELLENSIKKGSELQEKLEYQNYLTLDYEKDKQEYINNLLKEK